jgi:hypothetical protein
MFCTPRLFFAGTVAVGSRFHVLRSRTRFSEVPRRRVPLSCFALPDPFSSVSRASCPVFMFCTPGLVFGGTEGVGSRYLVLRARTRIRLYRGRGVPFSCISRPASFSAVPRALGPVLMFCAAGPIFVGPEGVESLFHVLRARNRFRLFRGRRVTFSRFALPDSFSAVLRASGTVLMFCAPRLIFGGTEGVESRFHVLRSRTHFRRNRGCRFTFSCFALPESFSTFYRVRKIPFSCFAGPESFSAIPRASGPVFMFCATGLAFDGIEGVGSCFHILRAQTRFQLYLGRRVSFSCCERPVSFSAVPRASGPVFMFCAPDPFSALPWASGPVFMFCAP